MTYREAIFQITLILTGLGLVEWGLIEWILPG